MAVVDATRSVHLVDETGTRRDKFSTRSSDPAVSERTYAVTGMAFSPDSMRLAIAQTDKIVFVFKLGLEWGDKKSICNRFKDPAAITALGLHALQHRGQEASGIVTFDGRLFHNHRAAGLVGDIFGTQAIMAKLVGYSAIGHNRYATTGGSSDRNIQPIFADFDFGGLALAHNGNLTNAVDLRNRLVQNGSIFQSTSDTECILQLIAKSKKPRVTDRFVEALHDIEGAYALVALTENMMIGARDPIGIRPLVLGESSGAMILASETCALDMIGAKFVRTIEPGEVVSARELSDVPVRASQIRSLEHAAALAWFMAQDGGFATCPITQGTLLRLAGHGEHDDGSYVPAGLRERFGDCVPLYERRLLDQGVLGQAAAAALWDDARAQVQTALDQERNISVAIGIVILSLLAIADILAFADIVGTGTSEAPPFEKGVDTASHLGSRSAIENPNIATRASIAAQRAWPAGVSIGSCRTSAPR